MKLVDLFKIFWLLTFAFSTAEAMAFSSQKAIVLTMAGAITPASQDNFHKTLEYARQQNATMVILQLDTPGGLDTSMRGIIKDILSSPIPIVTYVSPKGARAASAGTYILYASHIAAMAPATNLGAATGVSIGGMPQIEGDNQQKVLRAKLNNDAIAYIRGLAQLHGRNAEWAEKAVKDAASLPAKEALKLGVIDLIAEDFTDLLQQLNRKTMTVQGVQLELQTKDMILEEMQLDWRSRLLSVITDPSVAYLLLLIGIYGLFFEFASPGYVLPGVIGAIVFLLALYAFQLLPINYVGLALILLGIIFMGAEAFTPTFGLGIGGIIAFIAGSVLLLEGNEIYRIPWVLILIMSAITIAFFLTIIRLAFKARYKKVVSGREDLMESVGKIYQDFQGVYWIKIKGESWQVESEQPLHPGQQVKVIAVEGLALRVEPISEKLSNPQKKEH